MVFNASNFNNCMFCGGSMLLQHHGVFHPFKPDHGPFDIYACKECGSVQTCPMPSRESLTSLYGSYQDGLPELHRTIMKEDPQTAVYGQCVNRITSLSKRLASDEFVWLDIGAGGGEFATLMSSAFPKSKGIAVDQHSRPASLADVSIVEWREADINQLEFSDNLPQADVVASIAVWEHVLCPDLFVRNLLRLVKPGGILYLLCPNNASLASRLLGKRWPLFTPGEHLAMPTKKGAVRCVQREWNLLHGDESIDVFSQGKMLPYTVRYLMRRLGVDAIGRMLPIGLSFPLPVGALETVAIRTAVNEANPN